MPENSSKQCSVNKYFQLHFFGILVLPSMGFEPTRLRVGSNIYAYTYSMWQ